MSIILNPLESGHRQYAESLTSTPLACPVFEVSIKKRKTKLIVFVFLLVTAIANCSS